MLRQGFFMAVSFYGCKLVKPIGAIQ